jgi:hypothetical protein
VRTERSARLWRAMTGIVGSRAPAFVVELHQRGDLPLDAEGWRSAYSRVGRRVGHEALEPRAAELLAEAGADWGFTFDQLARALMLLELESRTPPDGFPLQLASLFRTGDSREREAILRVLPLFADPARHAPLAVDACRSHVASVFAAIACDNPYPRDHLAEPAFNQLAIKAVFLGLPLGAVRGLDARRGDELDRMAADYARELGAAGRPIPPDLSLLGVRS